MGTVLLLGALAFGVVGLFGIASALTGRSIRDGLRDL
jgi:hypothetical protein